MARPYPKDFQTRAKNAPAKPQKRRAPNSTLPASEKRMSQRSAKQAEVAAHDARVKAAARKEREDAERRARMDVLSAILDVCGDQSLTPAKKVTAIETYARRALEKEQAAA